ncbi:hypothetical protein [Okeania hirsuta]|nr:hypothetical protein [Okeania hirsuta]
MSEHALPLFSQCKRGSLLKAVYQSAVVGQEGLVASAVALRLSQPVRPYG